MFDRLTLDRRSSNKKNFYLINPTLRHRVCYQGQISGKDLIKMPYFDVQDSILDTQLSPHMDSQRQIKTPAYKISKRQQSDFSIKKISQSNSQMFSPKSLSPPAFLFDSSKYKLGRQLNLQNQTDQSMKASQFGRYDFQGVNLKLNMSMDKDDENPKNLIQKSDCSSNVKSNKRMINSTRLEHISSPKIDNRRQRMKTQQFLSRTLHHQVGLKSPEIIQDKPKESVIQTQPYFAYESAEKINKLLTLTPFKSKLIDVNCDEQLEQYETKSTRSLVDLIQKNKFKLLKFKSLNKHDFSTNKIFSQNAYQKVGSYELIQAVKRNKVSLANELLLRNLYLVYDYDHLFMTALHWACKKGYMACVKLILSYEPDLDAQDIIGRTSLYHAFENNHNEVAQELLIFKASPWSTIKMDYTQLYDTNQGCKLILSTRRKFDILLVMTPLNSRSKVWIDFSLSVLMK